MFYFKILRTYSWQRTSFVDLYDIKINLKSYDVWGCKLQKILLPPKRITSWAIPGNINSELNKNIASSSVLSRFILYK